MKIKALERKPDLGLLIFRVALGVMMLLHGIHKIFHGISGIKSLTVANGFPEFLAYGVYLGEVVAPILIILGYRTRVFGAILAGNCVFAWYMAHRSQLFVLNAQGGWQIELLGLYFFGALLLVFTGGGKNVMSHSSMWD